MQTKNIPFHDGNEIPQIGLGVFRTLEGEETENAVRWALEAGYRHIDTAGFYKNETSVGRGIKVSGVPREEIFLTTKIWNDDIRAGRAKEAFAESLERLDTDYVDLLLIHWPVENREKAWQDFIELQKEGKIRSIAPPSAPNGTTPGAGRAYKNPHSAGCGGFFV